MSPVPRKAPFRCPSCGFIQEEPEHLISTYCRRCGSHYEVRANSAHHSLSDRFEHLRHRIWHRASPLPGRKIVCHRCGRAHDVSGYARSTICPFCNSAIDLCDVTVASVTSRPIDTRGNLRITPSGYVCSALTICHSALVAGRISGTLLCEATLRLTCTGRVSCQLNAASVVIDHRAQLELAYPVRSGQLTVYGQAAGSFECTGRISILRGGSIEGRICAGSVVVEPGGILLADCLVHPLPDCKYEPVEREERFEVPVSAEPPLPAY